MSTIKLWLFLVYCKKREIEKLIKTFRRLETVNEKLIPVHKRAEIRGVLSAKQLQYQERMKNLKERSKNKATSSNAAEQQSLEDLRKSLDFGSRPESSRTMADQTESKDETSKSGKNEPQVKNQVPGVSNNLKEEVMRSQASLSKLKDFEKEVEEDARFIREKTKETIENFRKTFQLELEEFKAEAEIYKEAIKAMRERREVESIGEEQKTAESQEDLEKK